MPREHRKDINPIRLHSKQFKPASIIESTLEDGAIKMLIQGWASTTEKDYDGDIIDPAGIDLTRYKLNPIVKMGHQRGVDYNIGYADVFVKNVDGINGLWIDATVILHPEIEQHKKWIHGLRHGLINGFSIGFAKIVFGKDSNGNKIISSCELHEVSPVDIPNNPLTVRKTLSLAEHMKYGTKQIDLATLIVGQMIRYVKNEYYSDRDGDVYQWTYCNNAEVVKIDGSTVYLLVYQLTLDGFAPTQSFDICDVNEITMVEVSEEQLKGLKEIEPANIVDTDNPDEKVDPVNPPVDQPSDNPETSPETIADDQEIDESEKSLGNEEANKQITTELEQTKSLLDAKTTELTEMTKQLDDQKALNTQLTKDLADSVELNDQAAKAITDQANENTTLKSSLQKATENYQKLGKLYAPQQEKQKNTIQEKINNPHLVSHLI